MDQLYLCKCVMCISNNHDGIYLSQLIFNRHRRKEQILSIKDDKNVIQVEGQTNNQDLDVEFYENIIENIDDIKDFDNFDLEIISDNEEDDDNDDDDDITSQEDEEEEEDDDIEEVEEDDDDNSEDSDNAMQIEDHNIISLEIIEGLKLLYVKSKYNFMEAAYNDIIKVFAKKTLVYI